MAHDEGARRPLPEGKSRECGRISVYLEDSAYIALCDLLKLAGLADSGGRAKAVIAAGLVRRNGAVETRKTAKIRGGEVIEFDGAVLEIENGHDPET